MILNPITALSEQLQKLITEHGSATILRDHLALFKDQVVILEKKATLLESENAGLKTENRKLKTKIQQLTEENDKLRQKIQKYEHPHDTLLDKEKTDILLYLHKHIGDSFTFQIAQTLNLSEDIAKYHLEELRKNEFVSEGLPTLPAQHSWSIDDNGTKYLIENKLIS